MKIIKIKITFLLFILGVTFYSCNRFLDLKSDASYVIPQSLEDIQGLLDDAQRMNYSAYPVIGVSLSDDFYFTQEVFNSRQERGRQIYLWELTEYEGGADWGPSYRVVYNANLAMELLDKIDRTASIAEQWDNILGSALFYRAYIFLALVTQYGHAFNEMNADQNLGIPLRRSSNFNEVSFRSTIRECYNQILLDLKEAAGLLPNNPITLMRPSKAAAYALLARTTLYMGKYEQTLEYTDLALKIKNELIDFDRDKDVVDLGATFSMKQFNKETIFYAQSTGSWQTYAFNTSIIDSVITNGYREGDLRRQAYFTTINENLYFSGSYTGSHILFVGISTNELYLMRAEARAYLDDTEGAMYDLNTLLTSRWDKSLEYLPLVANSKEEALRIVREERRKEMLIRNMRWIDIKRYNREGEGIVLKRFVNGQEYTLLPNDPYYAFPLPFDIVQMTGMQQN